LQKKIIDVYEGYYILENVETAIVLAIVRQIFE